MIDGLSVLNPPSLGIRLNMDNIQYVSGRTPLKTWIKSDHTPNLGSVLKSHFLNNDLK